MGRSDAHSVNSTDSEGKAGARKSCPLNVDNGQTAECRGTNNQTKVDRTRFEFL